MVERIAVVTGAGRGIGRGVARRLSADGYRVALSARSVDELAESAAGCVGETMTVPADLTEADAADRLVDAVEQRWGPVEVLIANAGAATSAPLARTTDVEWQRILDINLTAPFRCMRRVTPGMVAAGYGRIVAVASIASRVGEKYLSAYTASKHGVLGLVRSVAAEMAGKGVTANAVCPAYVDTPMTDAGIANIAELTGRTPQQAREILVGKQPIGRLISVDEVVAAVLFCLDTPGMTGQAVNIDGGAVQS